MTDIETKTLGVIGGLGPLATARFLELITDMTAAETDQEHIHVLIDSNPATPDRTAFLLGDTDRDPYPYLLRGGMNLKKIGAQVLAIPCNTAHRFYDRLTEDIGLPIVHMIRNTAEYLKRRGIRQAGILATDGTNAVGIYRDHFDEAGIGTLFPPKDDQALVMKAIYDGVKAGRPVAKEELLAVSDRLRERGAQIIVLGCTELSVVKKNYPLGAGFTDAMEIMSAAAIAACGAAVKPEYEELITV